MEGVKIEGVEREGVRKRVEGWFTDNQNLTSSVRRSFPHLTLHYTHQHTHTSMHCFVTKASCVRSQNVGTAK